MNDQNEKLRLFIEKYGIESGLETVRKYAPVYKAVIERDLASPPQLSMLKTFIDPNGALEDSDISAIDAGGTKLRGCSFKLRGGKLSRSEISERLLPGKDRKINSDEFFDVLAAALPEDGSRRAGICFSYQIRSLENGDAEVLSLSKELSIPDIIGRNVGEEINKALERAGRPTKECIVLNDTCSVFLNSETVPEPDNIIAGMVLGTGFNVCFADRETGLLVNSECGSFDGFPRSEIDLILDNASEKPGWHPAEKMISGQYILKLCDMYRKEAGAQGITSEEDLKTVEYAVTDRAAAYVCSILCGILEYYSDKLVKNNVYYIVADGSAVIKNERLRTTLERLLKEYSENILQIGCEMVYAEGSSLTGTAIAAAKMH